MTKTFARSNPFFFCFDRASMGHTRSLLLSVSMLLTAGCGDDFSTTNETSGEASTSTSGTSGHTSVAPRPHSSTTAGTSPETSERDPNGGTSVADGTRVDGGVQDAGVQGPMPPDGPGEIPDRDCGGEHQVCCAEDVCRRGLTCAPSTDIDASLETLFTCERHGEVPPGADAAPPGPGVPPLPDGDAAPPGPDMPPLAPDMDAAPPPPPEPDNDCGGAGEPCCKGPGGRCDRGLTCENPNGPELDDSECLAEG